jgi:hypothetical protein
MAPGFHPLWHQTRRGKYEQSSLAWVALPGSSGPGPSSPSNLDLASGLTDYRRRREALRNWSLTPAAWHEIITSLPPVPGPVRPSLDDRKRQEASAFTWARITGGEPLFAPRPIEAGQPDHIRRAWLQRRGNTWFQLTRPDPLSHYAALRARLNEHADQIAQKIDDDPCWRISMWPQLRDSRRRSLARTF